MAPNPKKIQDDQVWLRPTDAYVLRRFLDLASYYRRYIHRFADIASLLHDLTEMGVTYN